MFEFSRVLITGGAGFIGSEFVRRCVHRHRDWQITVLDKLTYAADVSYIGGLIRCIRFVHGDICDMEAVSRAMRGCDAVVNFAAESHVDRSIGDPNVFVRSNVSGVQVLLESARKMGVRRYLQISTDEVFGDIPPNAPPSREGDPFAPRSPYAASKAAAEHFVMAYATTYGMNVGITRGSNTYGPCQHVEKAIPKFLTAAMRNEPVTIHGNGSSVRDYMYVEDHAAGIDLVLHEGKPGMAYNLAAQQPFTARAVAEIVLKLLDKPETLIQSIPERPGLDQRYCMDTSRAEGLGWEPRWLFLNGIETTARWYLARHLAEQGGGS